MPRPTHTVAAMAKELYIIDGHAHIYAAYFAPIVYHAFFGKPSAAERVCPTTSDSRIPKTDMAFTGDTIVQGASQRKLRTLPAGKMLASRGVPQPSRAILAPCGADG